MVEEFKRAPLLSEDLSNYLIPKQRGSQEDRLQNFLKTVDVPLDKLQSLKNDFVAELVAGLKLHKEGQLVWPANVCNFKMIDSHAPNLPTSEEKGVFYALDFGGTNLRAVRVSLDNGKVTTTQAKYSLKYGGFCGHGKGLLDREASATELFDHFATRIQLVMENAGDHKLPDPCPLGFTFSFPCNQKGITKASLIEWTKGFETGRATDDPVEKMDVGELLERALIHHKVPLKLSAILNDTVGTLYSCAYQKKKEDPPCKVGVIIGTGCNACYAEPEYKEYGYTGRVINIECGGFSRNLPLCAIDVEIDFYSNNTGSQQFEKLVSGAYLGELVRRAVITVFQNRAPEFAWVPETFTAQDAADILDDSTKDLSICRRCIERVWEETKMTHEDLVHIQKICTAIYKRSAALVSVIISALFVRVGTNESMTCGIDGSLFVKNPWYARCINDFLASILGKDASKITIAPADDGSGKGAAVLAATCTA